MLSIFSNICSILFDKFLYKIYIPDFEKIVVEVDGSDESYINRVGKNEEHFSFWEESREQPRLTNRRGAYENIANANGPARRIRAHHHSNQCTCQ